MRGLSFVIVMFMVLAGSSMLQAAPMTVDELCAQMKK